MTTTAEKIERRTMSCGNCDHPIRWTLAGWVHNEHDSRRCLVAITDGTGQRVGWRETALEAATPRGDLGQWDGREVWQAFQLVAEAPGLSVLDYVMGLIDKLVGSGDEPADIAADESFVGGARSMVRELLQQEFPPQPKPPAWPTITFPRRGSAELVVWQADAWHSTPALDPLNHSAKNCAAILRARNYLNPGSVPGGCPQLSAHGEWLHLEVSTNPERPSSGARWGEFVKPYRAMVGAEFDSGVEAQKAHDARVAELGDPYEEAQR